MAKKKYKIQQRYDTAANWSRENPVLLIAEYGIISDSASGEYKVGDGKTPWNGLPMYRHWDGSSTGGGSSIVVDQKLDEHSHNAVSNSAVSAKLRTLEKGVGEANRPATTTAMGYKVLKSDLPFEKQVTEPNTIYEIRDKYTVGIFTMPKNCILKFNGGILVNGTLSGNHTKIDADIVRIFGDDLTLDKSFDIVNIYAEWFGAESFYKKTSMSNEQTGFTEVSIPEEVMSLPDAAPAINKAVLLSSMSTGQVELLSRMYHTQTTIEMSIRSTIHTQNNTVIVADMRGSGNKKLTHSTIDGTFLESTTTTPYYSLAANELFANDAMAIAIRMTSVKSRLYGNGSLTLLKCRYTIGIMVESEGRMYMDSTYMAPEIDFTVCGEKANIQSPDPRDLVGEGAPLLPIGSMNEEKIYYWDKIGKVYYYKNAVGDDGQETEWTFLNGEADPHWCTCVRLNVKAGSFEGRIFNPQMRLRLIYGARGLEVLARGDNSWFNESYIDGSITEMYSNYISIYAGNQNNSVDAHDWGKLLCQSSNKSMYDSSMFYAIRSGGIRLGHFWDVTWLGSKQHFNYYLGKFTKNINLPSPDGKLLDLGTNNKYPGQIDYSNRESFVSKIYKNIWDGYLPSKTIFGGVLNRALKEEDINITTLKELTNGQNPSPYLFDSDLTTQERAINTDDNMFGYFFNFNNGIDTEIWTQTRYNPVIIFKYKIIGRNASKEKIKLRIFGGDANNTNYIEWSKDFNIYKPNMAGQIGGNPITESLIIPLPARFARAISFVLYTKEALPELTLDIVSIEYYLDGLGPDYSKIISNNNTRPTAPKKGCFYIDPKTDTPYINLGDAKVPNWINLDSGIPVKKHSSSESSVTIEPNVYHQWEIMSSLDITLKNTQESNKILEYNIQFKSGSTPTTLTISGIKWMGGDPNIEKNKTYQVNIINNIGVIGGI